MKRVALVTGGSRGIGRAVSVKLAAEGYYVLVNYVSNDAAAQETLALMQDACGAPAGELLKFDVADYAATEKALADWQAANPDDYISVLVNNAGIRKDNLLLWMEPDDWYKVLRTNLDSFYNVSKQVLQPMVVHRGGRIINIASLSGLKGLPGQTNYSAAKGGLIAATKALAQEVAARKVTVNAVAPGFIATDMVEGLDADELAKTIPAKRFGKPEEVADLVAFLASEKAGYINGEVISINGGIY
ncbi:MAG: 3-oxoacyl-ACP reductase FabG [Bacteroidales bacterium]|nr:3-oxoacyl-ACP reductase FabG [Bacteroidales bacterium]